jgi:hypothetical protein
LNHPAINSPHPNSIDDDRTGLGHDDASLAQQRAASGGLSDDPGESGAPVVNPVPFKNLKGGR